jgi:hypothetical protein
VEGGERLSHPLHPAVVVVDAQIALYEEPKLCVEVEGACLVVAEELLLEGNPKLLSGAVAGTSGLLEVDADGAEQPRQDHAIHLVLVGVVEGRNVGGDVVIESVALERQQHEVASTRVLGGRDVEDDGHQGPDVLDADSLSVEVADGGLERANCGGCLSWCHRRCWCCIGSRTRWRCSDSEDGSELELEDGRGSLRLLGLGLDGGDARLKGCKGSGEVRRGRPEWWRLPRWLRPRLPWQPTLAATRHRRR